MSLPAHGNYDTKVNGLLITGFIALFVVSYCYHYEHTIKSYGNEAISKKKIYIMSDGVNSHPNCRRGCKNRAKPKIADIIPDNMQQN